MSSIWPLIQARRQVLADTLRDHLGPIARDCAAQWPDADALDGLLTVALARVPGCDLLYALDRHGRQLSANIGINGVDHSARGQDLSGRPFLDYVTPFGELGVSRVYISRVTRRSCVTAVYRVHSDSVRVLGYLAADFDLSNLTLAGEAILAPSGWRQVKGDPAIRAGLFQQTRSESAMDRHIDDVHDIVTELLASRGVFHVELYYSASRAILWLDEDPRRYRLHVLQEIIDPAICLAYPVRPYPGDAQLGSAQIGAVLARFRQLRLSDQTVYLRAGSLNLINGTVSLNFSCDGTHYLPAQAFLDQPAGFWVS
jgi:hypothetical protein